MPKDNEASQISSASSAAGKSKGKRGRKLTETNKFLFESQKKIDKPQEQLKTDKSLNAEGRQKIRNQISAQRSRANKRSETLELS